METTGPEAVPVHSKESPPGHSRVPTAEEVNTQTDSSSCFLSKQIHFNKTTRNIQVVKIKVILLVVHIRNN